MALSKWIPMRLLLSLTVIGVVRRCAIASALAWAAGLTGPNAWAAPVVNVRALVEAAAHDELDARARQAHWLEPQWELTVLDGTVEGSKPEVLTCAQAPTVAPIQLEFVARMRWRVSCAEPLPWQRQVVVRAKVSAQVLVLTTEVPAGRVIVDQDMSLARREVTATPDAISEPAAVLGLTSSRTLRAGQVVTRRVLQTPVLVGRGQSVGIVASQNGVEVTVPGEALDSGREGDIVRVRNVASRRVIRARVIEVGKVTPESMVLRSPDQSRD